MKKENKKTTNKNSGIIALLLIIIICLSASFGYYYYITESNNNKKIVKNEETKEEIYKETISLAVGETVHLNKYIKDIDNIKNAVLDNDEVFTIDSDYIITANYIGNDILSVIYKDNKIVKYKVSCQMEMLAIDIGETVDLTEYIDKDKKVKEITTSNDSFKIDENKVTSTNEGETVITITYSDNATYSIKIKCETKNSNALAPTTPVYTITFNQFPKEYNLKYSGTTYINEQYKSRFYTTGPGNLIKVRIPLYNNRVFKGYYTDKKCQGKQVIDENGYLKVSSGYFKKNTMVYVCAQTEFQANKSLNKILSLDEAPAWKMITGSSFTSKPKLGQISASTMSKKMKTITITYRTWTTNPNTFEGNIRSIPVTTKTGKITVNEELAELWKSFFNDIYINVPNFVIASLDGCYNFRTVTGNSTTLSSHSFGTACDINASTKGNGFKQTSYSSWKEVQQKVPGKEKYQVIYKNSPVTKIAHKYGLANGSDWNSSHDSMHFSYIGDKTRSVIKGLPK